jgi:hypothetical protein
MGSFLKVGKSPVKDRRLYCMRITTPEQVYYKFGVASGHSAKERLIQIAASYYDTYRETPVIKLMRDRKVDADFVFKYETTLHRFFAFYKFDSHLNRSFDGSTECFSVEIDPALQAYDAVLDGMEPDFEYKKDEDKIPF